MVYSFVNLIATTIAFQSIISQSSALTICNSTICTIICNESAPCRNSTIDASQSTALNLTCSTNAACAYLELQGPSDSAHIHCVGNSSCQYAWFNMTNTKHLVYLSCRTAYRWEDKTQCRGTTLYAPNTTEIHVECESEYACPDSVFHIEYANSASFAMTSYQSMYGAQIYANYTKEMLNILCNSVSACKYLDIYATSASSTLNMYCSGYHSCYESKIYCPAYAPCNIECTVNAPPYDASCAITTIHIPNSTYHMKLICPEPACWNIDIQCQNQPRLAPTALTYANSELDALQCSDPQCCPSSLHTICPANVGCVIDCVNDNCEYRYVDGSLATSLIIQCEQEFNCQHMKIKCPNIKGSVCEIQCHGDSVCSSVRIDASLTGTLSLNCTAFNSCGSLQLINGPLKQANITCLDLHSCSVALFNVSDTAALEMKCNSLNSKACYNATVDAMHTDTVHVECGSKEDCLNMIVYGHHTVSTNIDCLAPFSCSNMMVFTQSAQRLNLICHGAGSCINGKVYCPYNDVDKCYVECFGHNSCDSMKILVTDYYDYNYLELYCTEYSCDLLDFVCVISGITNGIEYCANRDIFDINSCCPHMDSIQYLSISTTAMTTSEYILPSSSYSMSSTFLLSSPTTSRPKRSTSTYIIIIAIIAATILVAFIIAAFCWRKHKNAKDKNEEKCDRKRYDVVNRNSAEFAQEDEQPSDVEELRKDDSKSSIESMYDNPQNNQRTTTDSIPLKILQAMQPTADTSAGPQADDKADGVFVVDTADIHRGVAPDGKQRKTYVVQWNTDDLLQWIFALEDGRYKKYKQQLSDGFHREQVNGQNIQDLGAQDLRNYGVYLLNDRQALMKHIQQCVNSEMYQPQLEGQIQA